MLVMRQIAEVTDCISLEPNAGKSDADKTSVEATIRGRDSKGQNIILAYLNINYRDRRADEDRTAFRRTSLEKSAFCG